MVFWAQLLGTSAATAEKVYEAAVYSVGFCFRNYLTRSRDYFGERELIVVFGNKRLPTLYSESNGEKQTFLDVEMEF